MKMKNLFSGKLKSDQIFIKTIGSGGPGNSWVSAITTKRNKDKFEVWYNPDLTEEEEYEPYILGTIDSALEPRELIKLLSQEKPEGFYFDEITIKGVEGFWIDLIVLSLSEDYSELLEQILSLNDDDLKVFFQNEGSYLEKGFLQIDKLDRINEILFESLEESGKSDLSLSQLLNHTELREKLSIDALEEQIEIWSEEEDEKQDRIRSIKEARDKEIQSFFKDDIDFAVINYPKYSDIDEDIDDVLRDYLEKFVITHRKLPDDRIYYFKFGRRFHYRNFIINRSFRNSPTIYSSGMIDFKKIYSHVSKSH